MVLVVLNKDSRGFSNFDIRYILFFVTFFNYSCVFFMLEVSPRVLKSFANSRRKMNQMSFNEPENRICLNLFLKNAPGLLYFISSQRRCHKFNINVSLDILDRKAGFSIE